MGGAKGRRGNDMPARDATTTTTLLCCRGMRKREGNSARSDSQDGPDGFFLLSSLFFLSSPLPSSPLSLLRLFFI